MCFLFSVQFTLHPNCFIFSINFSLLIQFSIAFKTAIAQSATKLSLTCCRNKLYLSLLHAMTSPFSIWLPSKCFPFSATVSPRSRHIWLVSCFIRSRSFLVLCHYISLSSRQKKKRKPYFYDLRLFTNFTGDLL